MLPFETLDHPLYLWAAGTLPFLDSILDESHDWADKNIGRPYLCMVWRRNDFAEFCAHNVRAGEDCFQSLDYTVQKLASEAAIGGLSAVFVTTDGEDSEKRELLDAVATDAPDLEIVFRSPPHPVGEEPPPRKAANEGAMFAAPPVWGEIPEV